METSTSPQSKAEDILAGQDDNVVKDIIDLSTVGDQVTLAIDYITETRHDFEERNTQSWIDEALGFLEKTKMKIRDIEIEYVQEMVEWVDEKNVSHSAFARMQDEKAFDDLVRLYTESEKSFQDYFKKHIELLQTHPEKLEE